MHTSHVLPCISCTNFLNYFYWKMDPRLVHLNKSKSWPICTLAHQPRSSFHAQLFLTIFTKKWTPDSFTATRIWPGPPPKSSASVACGRVRLENTSSDTTWGSKTCPLCASPPNKQWRLCMPWLHRCWSSCMGCATYIYIYKNVCVCVCICVCM